MLIAFTKSATTEMMP